MHSRPAFAVVVAGLVAVAMAASAQDQSVDAALGLLRTDRSAKVRAQAALTLRAAAEVPEVRAVLKAALGDGAAIVRAAAATALGAVPHTDAYEALSRVAKDRDPLVAKWAGWALRRTVAAAPTVRVAEVRVQVTAPSRSDSLARTFEGALLGVLLGAGGRFEIEKTAATMDFAADGEASSTEVAEPDPDADRKALELMRQGRFDAAALAMGEGPGLDEAPVSVRLLAEIDARDAGTGAVAKVRLRGTTPEGTQAFEVSGEGTGRPPTVPENERDEYTTVPRPEDLRNEAVDAAGLAVAKALVKQLAAPEIPPDGPNGRAAR